jgi:hypothetical protein
MTPETFSRIRTFLLSEDGKAFVAGLKKQTPRLKLDPLGDKETYIFYAYIAEGYMRCIDSIENFTTSPRTEVEPELKPIED